MKEKITVFRSERKYMLGLEDRMRLIKSLNALLIPDAYGGYYGYRVRSVYFDGLDNQDYNEKCKNLNSSNEFGFEFTV